MTLAYFTPYTILTVFYCECYSFLVCGMVGWQEGHLAHEKTCATCSAMFCYRTSGGQKLRGNQLTQVHMETAIKTEAVLFFSVCVLPSNRRCRSNGDCLEYKRENHQVCSVQ